MDEQSWHVVRNTPGSQGSWASATSPHRLPQSEADTILKQMQTAAPTKFKVTLQPGQAVKIIDGPFEGFEGIVDNSKPGKRQSPCARFLLRSRNPCRTGLLAGGEIGLKHTTAKANDNQRIEGGGVEKPPLTTSNSSYNTSGFGLLNGV